MSEDSASKYFISVEKVTAKQCKEKQKIYCYPKFNCQPLYTDSTLCETYDIRFSRSVFRKACEGFCLKTPIVINAYLTHFFFFFLNN